MLLPALRAGAGLDLGRPPRGGGGTVIPWREIYLT
jgi:hypothetical protein